jgi:hypothetical protein
MLNYYVLIVKENNESENFMEFFWHVIYKIKYVFNDEMLNLSWYYNNFENMH